MSVAGRDHAHHHVAATSRLFRLRIRLSSAMWLPVLAANVVAVALAIGLPVLDQRLGDQHRVPITTSAAQAIFGALAGGMITFTGIVFSAVFVAAQIQTSSYSPRLAARIRRDPVVIAGLALPTATASYALFALAAIGRQTHRFGDFVPAVTVLFGLVLAAVTLGSFVALVQRAFDSTQIGGILRTLMRRAYAVIDDVHPRGAPAGDAVAPPADGRPREIAHTGLPAVIAAIDRAALLRVADQTGGFVDVVPVVGEYLAPGRVVLRISGAHEDPEPRLVRRVSCSPGSGRSIRIPRSRCGCSWTSRSVRSPRPSTIRRPPSRCSTGSRACSSSSRAGIPGRRSSSTMTAGPARG
jgi:uncharacterized membrane protein